MKAVTLAQIEFEVTQAKKALLEHFELVIVDPATWSRSRKKILDVFGDDGLSFRLRSLFDQQPTERKGPNV